MNRGEHWHIVATVGAETGRRGRRNPLQRVGLVALPVLAVLLLAGCHWGTYTSGGQTQYGHAYYVVVHQANTDNTIHACDDDPRSVSEAKCVLDVIKYACHKDPLNGWAPAECDGATNYVGTTCRRVPGPNGAPFEDENCAVAMQRAIAQIRSEQGQCITYEQYLGESSHGWSAAGTRPGC
jgi:hypothetical protein